MGGYNEELRVSRQEMFIVLGGMERNIEQRWGEGEQGKNWVKEKLLAKMESSLVLK